MFKEWFRWNMLSEKIESVSIVILIIATACTVAGISVGVFIPGIPVAIAIAGSFLVVVALFLYIVSEFVAMLEKKD